MVRWSFKEVQILEAVTEDKTKLITLKLPIELLTENMITNLDALCKEHKGKHKLKVMLIDNLNRNKLIFTSKNSMVNADSDFVNKVEKLGLNYKIN